MKKIMFVIGGLIGGGAERILTTVASYFAELKDFDVSILTYYSEQNEYPHSSKIKRFNISNGDKKTYSNMSSVKRILNIRKSVKEFKPDEIICFLPHALVITYLALIFSKYKKVLTYAERANPKIDNSRISKIKNRFIKKIKRILTQNEGQKKYYSNICNTEINVIPNPMYKELFGFEKQYSDIPSKIVSVGRLSNQKNIELGINAFYELKKQYKDLEYYIYGDGGNKEKLIELSKALNIENDVHFMGFEKDREKIYGDKDIYLMTSKFEGMPNTLAEAMCYGIPVISTNCDFGPSDLIANENMGILLKDYEIETVVEAIKTILDNYELYKNNAINSKKILADKYSYEKIMNLWYECFK